MHAAAASPIFAGLREEARARCWPTSSKPSDKEPFMVCLVCDTVDPKNPDKQHNKHWSVLCDPQAGINRFLYGSLDYDLVRRATVALKPATSR